MKIASIVVGAVLIRVGLLLAMGFALLTIVQRADACRMRGGDVIHAAISGQCQKARP